VWLSEGWLTPLGQSLLQQPTDMTINVIKAFTPSVSNINYIDVPNTESTPKPGEGLAAIASYNFRRDLIAIIDCMFLL
jgi:hypothetical protein